MENEIYINLMFNVFRDQSIFGFIDWCNHYFYVNVM